MLTHDVSKIPMSRRTPSSMSLIMSGGIRSDRISDKDSGFIFPTANLASLTSGLKHKNTLKRYEDTRSEYWHFSFHTISCSFYMFYYLNNCY